MRDCNQYPLELLNSAEIRPQIAEAMRRVELLKGLLKLAEKVEERDGKPSHAASTSRAH
jgi:hypothetical protein